MAKFYASFLPDGAVCYGKLWGIGPLNFHKFIGISTPDMHKNCLHAAIDDIMWIDSNPQIKVYYNGLQPYDEQTK